MFLAGFLYNEQKEKKMSENNNLVFTQDETEEAQAPFYFLTSNGNFIGLRNSSR